MPLNDQVNKSASAIKNSPTHDDSENSASISSDCVPHGEKNSCSIYKAKVAADNTNDNVASNNDEEDVKHSGSSSSCSSSEVANNIHVSNHDVKNERNGMRCENEETTEHQQVGVPLQRNSSSKRVHFAPSPPSHHKTATLATSESSSDDDENNENGDEDEDEEEEETVSEDIFYEAEAPNELQKLKILSTVTSHQSSSNGSECKRIDEEETSEEIDTSTSTTSSSVSSTSQSNDNNNKNKSNNNDVVCAKIIFSVNENDDTIKSGSSDNHNNNTDNERVDIQAVNAFSNGSETKSISNDYDDGDDVIKSDVPKTIKPTQYKRVGDEPVPLRDIVSLPDILLEQQQHINVDEV